MIGSLKLSFLLEEVNDALADRPVDIKFDPVTEERSAGQIIHRYSLI